VRLINSRKDCFKAYSGPWFKAIEDVLYKQKYFVKHVSVPDRRKLVSSLRRSGSYYYATDYTAFEAGLKKQIMDACECRMYRHMLSNFPAHAEFICDVVSGKQVCKYVGCSVEMPACRMSGDMCTSVGNGFTNLMLFNFMCEVVGVQFDGLVEGDDGLFATSGPITGATEFLARLGQVVKIEAVRDPCEASFCGMIFADQGVIKDPRKLFINFGWTSSYVYGGERVMRSLLRSKALSLAYECGSCPMAWALAVRALQLTRGVTVTHATQSYNVVPASEAECLSHLEPPSPATRALFADLFGISVPQQIKAEEYILASTDLLDPERLYLRYNSELYNTSYVVSG